MAIDRSNQYTFGTYYYELTRAGKASLGVQTSDWTDSYLNWRDGSAKNPNWREDIRRGNCATTFLEAERHTVRYSPTYVSVTDLGGATWNGNWAGRDLRHHISDAPQGFNVSAIDDLARVDLVRKANKIIRPFQGGVFLGELAETLRAITNPANGLIKELIKHKGNVANAISRVSKGSVAKLVSELWLEAAFGWQPLLGDIEDGVKALTRWDDPTKRTKLVTGRAEQIVPMYREYSEFVNTRPFRYSYETFREVRATVKYRAAIRFDPSHDTTSWKYSGLSLSDIPVAVWELIPYSFLADYFTNIGDIVEGYSFNKSYLKWIDRGQEVIFTRRSKCVNPHFFSTYWADPELNQLDGFFDFRGENLVATRRHVKRSKLDPLNFDSVPSFHWEVPGFGKKAINIAALLASRTL